MNSKPVWLLQAALAFCLATPLQAEDKDEISAATAAIDAVAPSALARQGTPGVAVAMVLGGQLVWSKGYGVADTETGKPVNSPSCVMRSMAWPSSPH